MPVRSPMERLRRHYERAERVCSECGCADDHREWETSTDGREVRYRHRCPCCGAVQERVLTLPLE